MKKFLFVVVGIFMVLATIQGSIAFTWFDTGLGSLDIQEVVVSDDGLHAFMFGGGFYYTNNGGEMWFLDDFSTTVYSAAMSGDGRYIVTVDGGGGANVPYISTDYGASFSAMNYTSTGLFSIEITSDGSKIVMTDVYSGLKMSTDNGSQWTDISPSFSVGMGMMGMSDDGNTIVVTDWGTGIYISNDAGGNWSFNDTITSTSIRNIHVSDDGQTIIIANFGTGEDGYISNDYGATWTADAQYGDGTWTAVCDDNCTVIFTGKGNLSEDGGSSWSSETPTGLYGIGISGNGSRIIAGAANFGTSYYGLSDAPVPSKWWAVHVVDDGAQDLQFALAEFGDNCSDTTDVNGIANVTDVTPGCDALSGTLQVNVSKSGYNSNSSSVGENQTGDVTLYQLIPADTSGFDGDTTDMSSPTALDNPILEKVGAMRIQWNGVDLDFQSANFSQYVTYAQSSGTGVQDYQEAHGVNLGSGFSDTAAAGLRISLNDDIDVTAFQFDPDSSGITNCYISVVGGSQVGSTTSIADGYATFSPAVELSSVNDYYFYCDANGGSYTLVYAAQSPSSDTYINWDSGYYAGPDTYFNNIIAVNFTAGDPIVFDQHWINVDSANLPADVNTSANLTFYQATGYTYPVLTQDGEECLDCELVNYNGTDAIFTVQHFTNYSMENGTRELFSGFPNLTSPTNNETIYSTSANMTILNVTLGSRDPYQKMFVSNSSAVDTEVSYWGNPGHASTFSRFGQSFQAGEDYLTHVQLWVFNSGNVLRDDVGGLVKLYEGNGTGGTVLETAQDLVNLTLTPVKLTKGNWYTIELDDLEAYYNLNNDQPGDPVNGYWDFAFVWTYTDYKIIDTNTNTSQLTYLLTGLPVGLNQLRFGATDLSDQGSIYWLDINVTLELCSPDWNCTGHATCPAGLGICNAVNDLNSCGLNYTGNYSEFDTLNCSISLDVDCGIVYPNEADLPSAQILTYNVTVDAAFNLSSPVLVSSMNGTSSVCALGTGYYQCNQTVHYYMDAGDYDVGAYIEDGNVSAVVNESGVCSVGALLARQISVNAVSFPTASPGVSNAQSSPVMLIYNTGNQPLDVSLVASDLIGAQTPSVKLFTSYFKAGSTLGGAVTLTSGSNDLSMTIDNGLNANASLYVWLTMPSNIMVQGYYSSTPWAVVTE